MMACVHGHGGHGIRAVFASAVRQLVFPPWGAGGDAVAPEQLQGLGHALQILLPGELAGFVDVGETESEPVIVIRTLAVARIPAHRDVTLDVYRVVVKRLPDSNVISPVVFA